MIEASPQYAKYFVVALGIFSLVVSLLALRESRRILHYGSVSFFTIQNGKRIPCGRWEDEFDSLWLRLAGVFGIPLALALCAVGIFDPLRLLH